MCAIAHVALELGLRDQRRDRVDHDDVDRSRAHQHVGDLERLLAVVGLREEQLLGAHAELAGVADVERVLGVDERARAAAALGLGDDVQGERRLARGLRSVHLDDAAARKAACAERDVEPQGARRDRRDLGERLPLAEPHDGALAELLLDLRDRRGERLSFLLLHRVHVGFSWFASAWAHATAHLCQKRSELDRAEKATDLRLDSGR
jgi:hypothetical protein